MRRLFFLITLVFTGHLNAQLLEGPLLEEGRELVSSPGFTMTDSHEGVIIFQLAVDRKGNVTSAKVINDGTTVVSTPARIAATKHVKGFKFKEGTCYPEFHQVSVKITLKAPQVKGQP